MVRREEGAVVGTLEVEDNFEDGLTYCRIDTENVVSRWFNIWKLILAETVTFVSDILEHLSHREQIQV